MFEEDEVNPQDLEALEETVGPLIQSDHPVRQQPDIDRIAVAVAHAQQEVVVKDTFTLILARMWVVLAALVAPVFSPTGSKTIEDNDTRPSKPD